MEVRTSGLPPVEFVRQTVSGYKRAGRQRIQEYARAYDAARYRVLGGHSPSAPGQPPGKNRGDLQSAPSRTTYTSSETASGWSYSFTRETIGPEKLIEQFLEGGTRNMPARPFLDAVLAAAAPEFRRIARLPIGP